MAKITITPKAGYLILPVSEYVGNHQLRIMKNGAAADDITLRLDYRNPTAYSYYPLDAFGGEEITLTVSPDMDLQDLQTDTPDHGDIGEAFRPFIHFTTKYGWINDPNGLLKYTSPVTGKTTYHMFYQFNPYDWVWGNMHWGHAVSDDLFHWEHLEPALYPDENGTMFSGSAIVDKENRSGLKTGDEDVILLFYTCAGNTSYRSHEKKFTQCIAYSNDGGRTFTKYEKNPVVGHIAADNRDPKVIWCEELGRYVMALYLDKDEYVLLTSENFLDWNELQRLHLERDGECPDFYPLNVNGDPSNRKWILSGAAHHYIVGEFVNGQFKVLQTSRPLNHGWNSYAAQTFSTDDEMERIQFAWDRNHSFGSGKFTGQMSVPYNMSLMETKDGYYLCAAPVENLSSIAADCRTFDHVAVTHAKPFAAELEEGAYEMDITLNPAALESDVRIEVFGQNIFLEASRNSVRVANDVMPMSMSAQNAELKFIIDKGSVEIFGSEGRAIMTTPWILNFNQRYITFTAADEKTALIEKITLKKLSL
ncbi:MAG: glycoside hydrolase family 32 protein [Clostridia bacterium]|nr:glycoside hydrolase family 32 protein [Clostridia bacterium]